jgi:hypothetical protein
MKTKFYLIAFVLVAIAGNLRAQTDTLALWHFENSAKRGLIIDNASFSTSPYTADDGTLANKDIAFLSKTGTNFTAWVTGTGGTGFFAPNANTWNGGTNSRYWQITISTIGYNNILLSSRQMSSNTGPRDFQIEYSTDGVVWTPVGPAVVSLNDVFVSGTVSDLVLPPACDNQPNLNIRWLMTSETSAGGGTVSSAGTSRIDDIIVKGTSGTFAQDAVLSPLSFVYNIDQPAPLKTTITWNDATSLVRITNNNIPTDTLQIGVDYELVVDTIRIFTSYLNTQFTAPGLQHQLIVRFDVGNVSNLTITWDDDNINGAVVQPDTVFYDLSVPTDLSTTITWNDASSITAIIDNQTIPYALVENTDYALAGNTLSIFDAYLGGLLTAAGQQILLNIEFDQGNDVVLVVKSIMSPPAPDVIAHWDFENATKRTAITDHAAFVASPYTADNGIVANINNSPVLLFGGNSFSGWVTGSTVGGFAPNSNNWNDGQSQKYWQIEVSTEGYGELLLSSKQRSSAGGPANFQVEYSINGVDWFAVASSNITCAENFTLGVLNDLPLPAQCNNRTLLFLRWVMTTNTAVNSSPVTTTGTNRIDDIIIKGSFITDQADIIDFGFWEETGPATIDPLAQTVDIEVQYGTNLTDLVAMFVLSPNATATVSGVSQISGDTDNDFSAEVEYLVTAGDGITSKIWTVTVTIANPSVEAEILNFVITDYTNYFLDINSATATVSLSVYGFDLVSLTAEFDLSIGAIAHVGGVLQESGVTVNDFDMPLVYTITAQDGVTQKNWTIEVEGYVNSVPETMGSISRVYPNPSSGIVHIEISSNARIDILNVSGQIVFSEKKESGSHVLELEGLAAGQYFIRSTTENNIQIMSIVIE